MRRHLPVLLGLMLVALLIGVPTAYSQYRHAHFRNFRIVEDGVLYRSGQMSLAGLKRTIDEYGIRTVVSLRDAHRPGDPPPDAAEEAFCKAQGYRYFRLTPRVWSVEADGTIPAEQNVREFLAILDDPANHPVLVHCFAGIHRTGTYCSIFRMEYHGWSLQQALAEMKHVGYTKLDDEPDVRTYLESYRPRRERATVAR